MKIYTLIITFLLPMICLAQMVDVNTPENVKPANTNIGANWSLDFSDEFNDNTLNVNKWTVQVSTSSRAPRPGLGITSWYWKNANVWLENGNLVLRVDKHNASTMYCGSINSNNKYETQYGYMECRLQIAEADKGTHTAFWLQGDGMGTVDGTANDGAEIDVFESAWLDDYTKSVVHIDGYGASHQANTKQYTTPGIHTGYHTFGLYWTEDFMKIYYDGVLKVTYSDAKWIVKAREYLWLSDGASFGISGDYFTKLPIGTLTHAYVDYVRVWKPTVVTVQSNPVQKLNIYPSSVRSQMRIEGLNEPQVVQIYNMAGALQLEVFTNDTIDCRSLTEGMHILKTPGYPSIKFYKSKI